MRLVHEIFLNVADGGKRKSPEGDWWGRGWELRCKDSALGLLLVLEEALRQRKKTFDPPQRGELRHPEEALPQ